MLKNKLTRWIFAILFLSQVYGCGGTAGELDSASVTSPASAFTAMPIPATPTVTPTPPPTATHTPSPTPTEVLPQPPIIEVASAPACIAGIRSSVNIDISDPNGDPFEVVVEQILGMGDMYSGTEYVTSQELAELKYEEDEIHFLANTPGNYRITVTAIDVNGETEVSIDVPIYWPAGENPFGIRGIAFDTWGPPDWNELDYVERLIDFAHDEGANFVQLAPYWHAGATVNGNDIQPCTDVPGRPCTTPQDADIRDWIQYAHTLGLSVLLKPHLIGGDFDRDSVRYGFESWQIQPSDPNAWFESYSSFIMHYAQIAAEEDVEIFSVGNELNGTTTYVSRWENQIQAIRSVYSGLLTYSDVLLWQSWQGQAWFWDSLDLIGIPYYYNGSDNNPQPSIPEMVENIQRVQRTNLARAMNSFDNLLLATEFGRPNFDGTNYDPWTWSTIVDNQELVDYIEAGFNTMLDLSPRFQGVFIWKLWPRERVFDMDWDFRGKPLGEAITYWFSN